MQQGAEHSVRVGDTRVVDVHAALGDRAARLPRRAVKPVATSSPAMASPDAAATVGSSARAASSVAAAGRRAPRAEQRCDAPRAASVATSPWTSAVTSYASRRCASLERPSATAPSASISARVRNVKTFRRSITSASSVLSQNW